MKIKVLLLSLVAVAATMASCQKDNVPGADPSTPISKGETAFAGISISFPDMGTKAPDDNASTLESQVSTVGIYIVDSTENIMGVLNYDYKVFDKTDFTQVDETWTMKGSMRTTTGKKYVYVVLNPTAKLTSDYLSKTGGYTSFKAVAKTDVLTPVKLDVSNFWDPTKGLVMASDTTVTFVVRETDSLKAIAIPVALKAQRNTARVAVKIDDNAAPDPLLCEIVENTVGGNDGLTFVPASVSKQSYMVSQFDAVDKKRLCPGSALNLSVPADLAKYTEYWGGGCKASSVSNGGEFVNFADAKIVNASTVPNKDLNSHYILENNNKKAFVGNTTAMIVRAKLKPTDGTVVTDWTDDNTLTKGNIGGETTYFISTYDNTVWSQAAVDKVQATVAPTQSKYKDTFNEYKDFFNYYRIFVQDSKKVIASTRNNFYVLNITKIKGYGKHEIVDAPETPLVEDAFISATVTVLPWSLQQYNTEI